MFDRHTFFNTFLNRQTAFKCLGAFVGLSFFMVDNAQLLLFLKAWYENEPLPDGRKVLVPLCESLVFIPGYLLMYNVVADMMENHANYLINYFSDLSNRENARTARQLEERIRRFYEREYQETEDDILPELEDDILPELEDSRDTSSNSMDINEANTILKNYNDGMTRYLKKFSDPDRKSNSTLASLLEIPQEELTKFLDCKTKQIVDIPVSLGPKLYDLNTLLNLKDFDNARKNPFNEDFFYLRDIQPEIDIQNEFEELISKYKIPHLTKADKTADCALELFKSGKYHEAKIEFENAIEIRNKVGDKSYGLSRYHYNLASTYHHLNDLSKAIEHCQISLNMREKLLGKTNVATERTAAKLQKLQELEIGNVAHQAKKHKSN